MADRANLEEIIGSLAALDVSSFTGDDLKRLVREAQRLANVVHALAAAAMDEFDRRGTWADEGSLSAAGWAAAWTGTPGGRSARRCELARSSGCGHRGQAQPGLVGFRRSTWVGWRAAIGPTRS